MDISAWVSSRLICPAPHSSIIKIQKHAEEPMPLNYYLRSEDRHDERMLHLGGCVHPSRSGSPLTVT